MKKITIGILAHVDAGKTTCIESLLYQAGVISKMGRVDHQDTILDYDAQEREHGITIFSKEAHFITGDTEVFVIDTPGHVDFSSEMERTLRVIDLAVVLINAQDGVQSHTETIWQCLNHYHIPAVIFVNKMDISHYTKEELLNDLQKHCNENCIAWDKDKEERLALVNEQMLSEYTEEGKISKEEILRSIYQRECFPVLFGSALKLDGIDDLMSLINEVSLEKIYPESFGARVYKISADEQGNRLTHMKITGGQLSSKEKITEEEKADQLRIYCGTKYQTVQSAEAGTIIAVKGLKSIETGDGLGFESNAEQSLLKAVMSYDLVLPKNANALVLADTCKKLAEEDPQLEITVDDKTKQISVRIMGKMQMEVLQKRIEEETGIIVGFTSGKIVYQETIQSTAEGAGHFEPLRHYAEVHVRLEPLSKGSGIVISNECPNDMLSSSFQSNILSALSRKRHKGVLTGSLLTDVKIILVSGKGNIKHTSGGDFYQAASRAVRQALMKADSILLEPYEELSLYIPSESLSKVLYDLEQRGAQVKVEETTEDMVHITGNGPVRTFANYQETLISNTKGKGRCTTSLSGYEPSPASSQIIAEIGYDPQEDQHNPSSSVFCANGTGIVIGWDEADAHMHIKEKEISSASYAHEKVKVSENDLKIILAQAGGKNQNTSKTAAKERKKKEEKEEKKVKAQPQLEQLLMVDGYNMIFAWDSLKDLARESLALARDRLINDLFNYQPYLGQHIILVFDGYKVKENIGTVINKGNLQIVYTKAGETADAYLERSAYELKGKYKVTYATSDALIQNAVFSQGGIRLPARSLENELKRRNVIL